MQPGGDRPAKRLGFLRHRRGGFGEEIRADVGALQDRFGKELAADLRDAVGKLGRLDGKVFRLPRQRIDLVAFGGELLALLDDHVRLGRCALCRRVAEFRLAGLDRIQPRPGGDGNRKDRPVQRFRFHLQVDKPCIVVLMLVDPLANAGELLACTVEIGVRLFKLRRRVRDGCRRRLCERRRSRKQHNREKDGEKAGDRQKAILVGQKHTTHRKHAIPHPSSHDCGHFKPDCRRG